MATEAARPDLTPRSYSTITSTESVAAALRTTTHVRPAPTPCTCARPFAAVTPATDPARDANVSPAELSRAPEPMSEARKLELSPRESVSRSNDVRIVAPASERSPAGGETGSGEQPPVSENAARTPSRVSEDDRIQASGVKRCEGPGAIDSVYRLIRPLPEVGA